MNEKSSFNFGAEIQQKNSVKNLYCAGGWVVDGGQKGPSVFLKFKYVNNKVMILLSISKKFVRNFLMGLLFGFEVGGGGKLFFKLPWVREFFNMWI